MKLALQILGYITVIGALCIGASVARDLHTIATQRSWSVTHERSLYNP